LFEADFCNFDKKEQIGHLIASPKQLPANHIEQRKTRNVCTERKLPSCLPQPNYAVRHWQNGAKLQKRTAIKAARKRIFSRLLQ